MKDVRDTQDEITEVIMNIEDRKDEFDDVYAAIDDRYIDLMKETGVYKLIYGYEFDEFNFALNERLDNLPDDKCPNCKENLLCNTHQMERQLQKKFTENSEKLKRQKFKQY